MKRDLPLLMNCWLNSPLCCSDSYGLTAAAVFSGRLDIKSVQTEFGKIEREELEAIASRAKHDADEKREAPRSDAKRAEWKRGGNIMAVDNIAVIQVYGALTRTWGVGPYSGSTGYDGIRLQLEEAIRDDDIKGIWFDIDSGGGTVNGLFDLADTIFLARSTNKDRINDKPIWSMAADYAYSAAYLIGTSGDRFYCPESGGCASIGTITMHTSYKRMLEDDGIDVNVLRYPENKFRATEFETLDQQTRDHIMAQLKQLTGAFQDRVARNLKLKKSVVADTKGLDYTGLQAKAIGLVTDALPESIVWENFRRLVAKR